VAVPDLSGAEEIWNQLIVMGAAPHEIGLKRTVTNPVADFGTIVEM
jgi:hypothetical protein